MTIVDQDGKPVQFWKKGSRCNICKRNLKWKHINKRWVPFLLTGEQDTCYQLKK